MTGSTYYGQYLLLGVRVEASGEEDHLRLEGTHLLRGWGLG